MIACLRKYSRYIWYLARHKYHVGRELIKHGLYWQAITHDLSKLLPSEIWSYANHFSCTIEERQARSSEFIQALKVAFDQSWLKHQHRNPHHWQHWILREDSGAYREIPMPQVYAIEMFCDWVGAGIAITGRRDVSSWYLKNKNVIALHQETRSFIESLMAQEE